MKAETYFFVNNDIKNRTVSRLIELPIGEDYKVVISKTGTKSQRQQGLNWRWNTEVAESGIGRCDDKMCVHREGKEMFAIPILFRDDPDYFPFILRRFREITNGSQAQLDEFLDTRVRTQDFTVSQTAEYLRDFERYWLSAGVNLTNPDLYGLKLR